MTKLTYDPFSSTHLEWYADDKSGSFAAPNFGDAMERLRLRIKAGAVPKEVDTVRVCNWKRVGYYFEPDYQQGSIYCGANLRYIMTGYHIW